MSVTPKRHLSSWRVLQSNPFSELCRALQGFSQEAFPKALTGRGALMGSSSRRGRQGWDRPYLSRWKAAISALCRWKSTK